MPVRKAAYDPELDGNAYNPDTFNHCTLFNGTIVSAVRGGRAGRPALAVVVCTGFNTAKVRCVVVHPLSHDVALRHGGVSSRRSKSTQPGAESA